jgi:hypothetical protein
MLIAMPIMRLALKIDVFKMEQAFQMGYKQGEKMFFVSPTNWQGEEISISFVEALWGLLWKEKNDKFEEFLQGDVNLRLLFGKMFHIWDGNHKLQMWFPYIEIVHPLEANWHIYVDSFALDSKIGLVKLLTTMIKLDK